MRTMGWLVLVIGLGVLVAGMGMDTTVHTADGRAVHNIGLLARKSNFTLMGLGALVLGVILLVAGRKPAGQEVPVAARGLADNTVACPYCAERIQAAARLCRFCQRDVVPQEVAPPAAAPPPPEAGLSIAELNALGVTREGLQWVYGAHRYDHLDDAVAYARKQRAAPAEPGA